MTNHESARRHDHLEIVYRWRVRQDDVDEFFARLVRIVEGSISGSRGEGAVSEQEPVTARVSQPVLGPAADIWELRLEMPDLGRASAFLERAGRGESDLLWELGAIGRPRAPGGSPVAEILESSAPLCRIWVFRPRPVG